jgi:Trypsin-co-occurring domain 1
MGAELLRWEIDGEPVIMETDEPIGDWAPATALGGRVVHDVKIRFEDSLGHVRTAALRALDTFREGMDAARRPDSVEIEFGVKFSAEAGAVIAKTALEGQLTVKLGWTAPAAPPDAPAEADGAGQ